MDTAEAFHGNGLDSRGIRSWGGPTLFLLGILVAYLSNGRLVGSWDNLPLRYLPLSILREGDFDLNEFPFLYRGDLLLYPIQYQNGRFLPFVPVGPSLLAVPFYLIPVVAGISGESPWLPQIEKVAAATIAALSALFLLLTLARLVPMKTAILTAGLYALGTATFGVSSQSLWPIGSAQLLLALGLYCLTRGLTDPRWIPSAAFPLAWAVICRPSTALIGMIVALYVVCHHRRQFLPFMIFAAPATIFQLTYNIVYFGTPFLPPGYMSTGGHLLAVPENFNTPLFKGLAGLLVSPAVGFFVYSPVFLFALIGFYHRWRGRDLLARYLAGAALAVLLLDSKVNMWWGGLVLGPRYAVEVSPILAYFLAFAVPRSEEAWKKRLFGLLAAWSVYANGLVAFAFDGSWDRQADLWSWSNSPIVYYSKRSLGTLRSIGPALVRQFRPLDSRTRLGLVADLRMAGLPSRMFTNSFFDMTVHVKNSGQAVWRRRTADGIGMVRFGWRWVKVGEGTRGQGEGRGPLLTSDLLPGRSTEFAARIWAPPEPGLYELELGMVSEGVAWFGPGKGAPVRVRVEVVGSSLCRFEEALAMMADPTEPPLHLRWVTDRTVFRAKEVFAARLNLSNPGPPRVLYPVIVLRWPSGAYSFLDFERQAFQSLCPGWVERAPATFLDQGYRAVGLPMFSLLLAKVPTGSYTLYFLYLKPKASTIRVAAMTTLTFELLP